LILIVRVAVFLIAHEAAENARKSMIRKQKYRVRFICTGNICRSPLAEELARGHVDRAGLAGRVAIDSFGTHDYHVGEGADPRTVATARRFGVDLAAHRARQVAAADCEAGDLILAMDSGHEQWLRRIAPAPARDRIHLYLPFVGIEGVRDVPDPYYGDADGFIAVHELLDRAAERLVRKLPSLIAAADG
jgi:protein-tyrosine phosphatase